MGLLIMVSIGFRLGTGCQEKFSFQAGQKNPVVLTGVHIVAVAVGQPLTGEWSSLVC